MLHRMVKESIGAKLKRLREQRGLSQRKLAMIVGLDRGYISQLEAGKTISITLRTAETLAKGLGIPPSAFFSEIEEIPPRSIKSILTEAQERYEALKLLELPIRGVVPAGYPFAEEEHIEGYVHVPMEELIGINLKELYTLRVSGNSLEGDNISSGDLVIVEPTTDVIEGKIYIVRLGNEVCARHVYKMNDYLRLVSSNGNYKEIKATEVEIQGRVILSGQWRKH